MGSLPPELVRVEHISTLIDPALSLSADSPPSDVRLVSVDPAVPSIRLQLRRRLLDFSIFEPDDVSALAKMYTNNPSESEVRKVQLAASVQSMARRISDLCLDRAQAFRQYLQEYLLIYLGASGLPDDMQDLYQFGQQLEQFLVDLESPNDPIS